MSCLLFATVVIHNYVNCSSPSLVCARFSQSSCRHLRVVFAGISLHLYCGHPLTMKFTSCIFKAFSQHAKSLFRKYFPTDRRKLSKSLSFPDRMMYMLFAGREVRIGKNCARGLEYPKPRAQFFPIRTDLGRQITCLLFSSVECFCKQFLC